MYEELIARMREAPTDWPDADLHYQAADAIEELSRIVKEQKKQIITMAEDGKTQWISVEERLPERGEPVLTCVKDMRTKGMRYVGLTGEPNT